MRRRASSQPVDKVPKHDVALLVEKDIVEYMDASEMGRRGAAATNKLLTTEKRVKAAKKGWKLRKQKLKEIKK